MKFILLFFCLILTVVLAMFLPATSKGLPSPEVLQDRMAFAAETVSVYEPHLSLKDQPVRVEYIGYPAIEVMVKLFGKDWQSQGDMVEFRALDGYISKIAVENFLQNKAWLVFARKDGAPFTVNNIRQNQMDVPLGPYYLVWDNVSNPDLIAKGDMNWPYQVKAINLIALPNEDALLGLDPRFHEGAGLVKTHCLNCHKVNGEGGDKFPVDLSILVKGYSRKDFMHTVLTPASERPGATMPAISSHLSESERRRIAEEIFNYLKAVPVKP